MSADGRRSTRAPSWASSSPMEEVMAIHCSNLVSEFARGYRSLLLIDHPGSELSDEEVQLALLCALEGTGQAVKRLNSDGIATWIATSNFIGHDGELLAKMTGSADVH